ncbi:hypothetical protein [Spirosoma arboris]|nr:hypothetical protein [Spirosoma arboris]
MAFPRYCFKDKEAFGMIDVTRVETRDLFDNESNNRGQTDPKHQ